jgi:hypothetical protein
LDVVAVYTGASTEFDKSRKYAFFFNDGLYCLALRRIAKTLANFFSTVTVMGAFQD